MRSSDEERQGPVIRDRRRIDPVTGQVRNAGGQADQGQGGSQHGPAQPRPGRHSVSRPGSASGGNPRGAPPGLAPQEDQDSEPAAEASQADRGDADQMAARLAERTADLQRLQAEYANYRKRVERDRIAVREQALANVLTELLPVLDDIGRAREHGELTGGFKSVAESLEAAALKLGLTSYGEDGDPFDPKLHDALMHSYSPDVTETTCVRILQPGYMVGERILRPARVAVAEPGEAEEADGPAHADHRGNEGGGDDASNQQSPSGTSGGD
jgi:molecular chaperone GrpE